MRKWLSEAVWAVLIALAIIWEMVGVLTEKRTKIEPLTRIVRDRLFKYKLVKVAVFLFLTWLGLHWFVPGW